MQENKNIEFLKLPAVKRKTGKSRSSIYASIKEGTFPLPVRIGPRAVAWSSIAIAEWQEARLKASQSA
jgi:prophage regulatory protein